MKRSIFRIVNIVPALMAAALFLSCEEEHFVDTDKESGSGEKPTLSVSAEDDRVYIKRENSQARIAVTSNTNWTAESDQEWCDVNPVSASGNGDIIITVPEKYTSIGGREARITVKATDEIYKVITVTQQGARLVNISDIQAGKPFNDYKLEINGLGLWTAEVIGEGTEWCTLAQTSGENYFENTISVSSNTTDQERQATIKIACGEEEETVTVIQTNIYPKPVVALTDENKVFSLSWSTVPGASEYVVKAVPESGQPIEIEVALEYGVNGAEVESYTYDLKKLYADNGNLIANMKVNVEAVSKDPDISSVSDETFDLHTLFAPGSGDGSEADKAYKIASARHLDNIRLTGAAYHYYQQIADIDLAGYDTDDDQSNGNFTTISKFAGIYTGRTESGDMSRISNLKIVTKETVAGDIQAIFGTIVGAEQSCISYLESVNPIIELTPKGSGNIACPTSPFVGTIDKAASLLIEYCQTSGNGYIKAPSNCQQLGGIIGQSLPNVIVRHCSNAIPIEGRNLGGIVGACAGGTIEYCSNTGNITGSKYVGGIGGTVNGNESVIRYCHNAGRIICTETGTTADITAGGITGRISSGSGCYIESCYNTGKIEATGSSNSNIGGIVGMVAAPGAFVMNCYNTGEIAAVGANANAGGITASINDKAGMISFCYNIGTISALGKKGAILGMYDATSGKANNSYFLEADGLNGVGNDASGTGTVSKSMSELETWETYSSWDPTKWEISAASTYKLPQLIDLPHVE